MGIIRKALAGSAAVATGGASLLVFQFRSDTERNTREIKKLRKSVDRASLAGGTASPSVPQGQQVSPAAVSFGGIEAASAFDSNDGSAAEPSDLTPGWKPHPNLDGHELLWNGQAWTSVSRKC